MQAAFREHHGLQCGYCTPGMVMAAVSLIDHGEVTDEASVRRGLEGNLCRCTGYHNIVQAVLAAAGQGRAHVIPAAFDYERADVGRRRRRAARPTTATTPSCSPAATRCCR